MPAAPPAPDAIEQHRRWLAKEIPPVEEVRRGIWSLPSPMPDNPLRYVISYAIETPEGLALVDTGWLADQSWNALEQGVHATGHDLADVSDVLVTHSHYDHHGLTRRVVERGGARVHMHSLEDESLKRLAGGNTGDLIEWLTDCGAPQGEIAEIRRQWGFSDSATASSIPTMAHADSLIEDGDRPLSGRPDIRAIWTPGHTAGHLCFLVERDRLLLAGDHVLPRITPHITREPSDERDALGDYLRSLRSMAELDVDEVLPAHEYRFGALAARVADMVAHHEQRLDEIVASSDDASTWDIARRISWSRGWDATVGFMRQSAINETFVHLQYLEANGRIRLTSRHPDRWLAVREGRGSHAVAQHDPGLPRMEYPGSKAFTTSAS